LGHKLARSAVRKSQPLARVALAQRTVRSYYDEREADEYVSRAKVLKPAPLFTANALMPDKSFAPLSLKDYQGRWVVLFFYPLDFTFVCPTEIAAFSDRFEEFKNMGTEVIAVSVDSEYSHLAWVKQERKDGGLGDMKIPLVADITKLISNDYGVLIDEEGISLRGLFIIDPEGTLRHMSVNDNRIGRSVDEALRLVGALQYAEKHGEVCPVNWKPGQAAMKSDPEGAKSYWTQTFSKTGKSA